MSRPFSEVKLEFDKTYATAATFECFLPVGTHLAGATTTGLRDVKGQPNEQYFKWQFLHALVRSGLYAPDYVGTELAFPKGNKSSAPLLLDVAIFDEKGWHEKYCQWHKTKDQTDLEWLRLHLVGVIEIKNEDGKDTEAVWNQQLKAYLKESERDFCLGGLYDKDRLWLFRKHLGKYVRFSDEYNTKGQDSGTKDLSLHLPDPFVNLLPFDKLLAWDRPANIDRSTRTIQDLDVISGLQSTQVNTSMSAILRTMDEKGLADYRGYEILIQLLALKIFDEKRNEKTSSRLLDFYLTDEERQYKDLLDKRVTPLLRRMASLRDDASSEYTRILADKQFNPQNASHVAVLVEVVRQFQDFSFVRSYKTDLYQLVFHRFATQFAKDANAQFVTPLPLIDFLVRIVNPRNGETVIDPTVGIADFLSVSYVNSNSKLDDGNIYGFDIDDKMVMLATLNMLLNGDGNARLESRPGQGSILTKFDHTGQLLDLQAEHNQNGDWDERPDGKRLKKFDVVLTNPPFGEDRAWRPTAAELPLAACYELWNVARTGDKIDKGIIFLENAVRILKPGGRLGVVLSNSIASIDRWEEARKWLLTQVRLVAIFDLPANVFAETGVNTTVIVAYKPETAAELARLRASKYKVFFRDINRVGYEVRTNKRVKNFVSQFRTDPLTFDVVVDDEGNAVLDEEFTQTIAEFKDWCLGQEADLQAGFIKEK